MTDTTEVDFVRVEAVLDVLPDLVAARMDYLGASYREVGRQAGVSFSTVHRFVDGGNDPSFRAAKHLLRWLAVTTPVVTPSVAGAKGGLPPVGPDETKQPDLVTHHEET